MLAGHTVMLYANMLSGRYAVVVKLTARPLRHTAPDSMLACPVGVDGIDVLRDAEM